MNQIQHVKRLGFLVGVLTSISLSPNAVAQSEESGLLPRLVIEEVAPPVVQASGSDIRLLATGASPVGLVGDQAKASIASWVSGTTANGFLVWHDNAIDGDGTGVGLRFLDLRSGVASPNIVQVNQTTAGNQENARVSALSGGGAVVVWQSGVTGGQSIVARLVSRSGAVVGNEFVIATPVNGVGHFRPVVASLPNGGFVIAWEAFGPDGVARKINLRQYDASGSPAGEVRIFGTTADVDRSVALAVHSSGKIVVAWVAEEPTTDVLALGGQATRLDVNSDIFAQVIHPDGTVTPSAWINGASAPCDSPALLALPNGKTLIGWSEFDIVGNSDWEIKYALLSPADVLLSSPAVLNTYHPFEQNYLSFAVNGSDCLAVWASRGADGSGLGIVGRSLTLDGAPRGEEMIFNVFKKTDQMEPAVASTATGYRVVWSGLSGVATGIDLAARDVRKISTTGSRSLKLSWNSVLGERYILETSTDLAHWETSKTFPPAISRQQSVTLNTATSANIYFRVKLDR